MKLKGPWLKGAKAKKASLRWPAAGHRFVVLLPGVFVLLGIGLMALSCKNFAHAISSRHWPTVSATVAQSETAEAGRFDHRHDLRQLLRPHPVSVHGRGPQIHH